MHFWVLHSLSEERGVEKPVKGEGDGFTIS
jgi:hypothetical protein